MVWTLLLHPCHPARVSAWAASLSREEVRLGKGCPSQAVSTAGRNGLTGSGLRVQSHVPVQTHTGPAPRRAPPEAQHRETEPED